MRQCLNLVVHKQFFRFTFRKVWTACLMWLSWGKLYIEHCKNINIIFSPYMFVFVFKCILCVFYPCMFFFPPMMQLFLYLHNFFVMLQVDIAWHSHSWCSISTRSLSNACIVPRSPQCLFASLNTWTTMAPLRTWIANLCTSGRGFSSSCRSPNQNGGWSCGAPSPRTHQAILEFIFKGLEPPCLVIGHESS